MNTFYNGLHGNIRASIDAASGGAFLAKSYEDAHDLIETMSTNNYQWPTSRMTQAKAAGVLELDGVTSLHATISALSMKFDKMNETVNTLAEAQAQRVQQVMAVCELCAGDHLTEQCAINPASVQYIGNYNRNPQNTYQNTYNQGNRNYPNLSWSNNQQTQAPRPSYPPGFHSHPQQMQQQDRKSDDEESWASYKTSTDLMLKNHTIALKNIENQIRQLALALNSRPQGTLPSDTERNSKGNHDQCQAVMLRSGKHLGGISAENSATPEEKADDSKAVEGTNQRNHS